MSLKTRRHKNQAQENLDTTNEPVVRSVNRDTVHAVIDTLNNHKVLIGGIAAAFGGAILLFTTESGKRLRDEIQNRAVDLYDSLSDEVLNRLDQVRDFANDILSHHEEAPGADRFAA